MTPDDSGTGKADELSSSPHDAFFKSVFSEPEFAASFFRQRLPPSVVAVAKWESLEVVPASFVKSSLSQIHSDLLFSVNLGEGNCLLYLLFEHQSMVDAAMPLRLLGYIAEILHRHYKQHGLPLPPVIPFVFHQGPERWTASPAFENLFVLPAAAAAELSSFLPKFRHALLDLSACDPANEEDDPALRVVLQLMKLARAHDMLRFFRWMAVSEAEQLPDSLLKRILLYALHADQDLDVEALYGHLSTNPHLQQQVMSVAEKLKAEGRQEGRQEGLLAGRIAGLVGQIQLLEEVLGLAISPREKLESLDLGELETRFQELHRDYKGLSKDR